MKRLLTATCLAASFAVGLAAQSTGTAGTAGTPTDPQAAGSQRGGGPRTATGCLRAGDTAGTFMLTDVTMQGRAGAGAGATGTTAGGTGATAGGTGTAGATAGGQATAPMSIMLTSDASVDLKAHVGHKVEVTGTLAGGRGRGAGAGTGAGATGTATGTGTPTTGGTATATGTGSTSGTGTAGATGTGQGGGRGPRNMTVTSVRMISESCS